jgi:hypothetical protein
MKEISPTEWVKWKAHRTTKKFFDYLDDARKQIGLDMAYNISEGNQISPEIINSDALRCQMLLTIQETELETINNFYQKEIEDVSE